MKSVVYIPCTPFRTVSQVFPLILNLLISCLVLSDQYKSLAFMSRATEVGALSEAAKDNALIYYWRQCRSSLSNYSLSIFFYLCILDIPESLFCSYFLRKRTIYKGNIKLLFITVILLTKHR